MAHKTIESFVDKVYSKPAKKIPQIKPMFNISITFGRVIYKTQNFTFLKTIEDTYMFNSNRQVPETWMESSNQKQKRYNNKRLFRK